MRLPVPGPRLDRWRLRAHWESMLARAYVEHYLGRKLTGEEFYTFRQPIYIQYRESA
jgi:hypothetical protein